MSKEIPTAVSGMRNPKPTFLNKGQIEGIGELVAKEMGYSPSSDLADLVVKIGGKISIKDFWRVDDVNEESIIVRSADDFEIFIPPHTSPERDRFTVAHELGHYVLHYIMDDTTKVHAGGFAASRYGSSRTEWEANWFAAGFLMPSEQFKTKYHELGKRIGRVADHFNVSTAAALVRAKALGLNQDASD